MNKSIIAGLYLLICSVITLPVTAASIAELKPQGIGIVVADAAKSTHAYNTLLGIQQWQMIDVELDNSNAALRIARGSLRGTRIELIEPLYGDSHVAAFLQTHGPGIYAVNLGKQKTTLTLPILDSASGINWYNSYPQLGVNLKLQAEDYSKEQAWGDINLPPQRIPMGEAARVAQLGIIVEDAMASAKAWRKLTGLAPWVFVDFKPPMTSNGFYLGARGTGFSHVHVAYGQWQQLQIELLQPVAGPTPHRDYLRSKGAGAHHLSLGRLPKHDALATYYQQLGITLQMQSDNGGEGRTASYMNTLAELGWVLEFTRAFKGLGNLQIVGQLGPQENK